MSHSVKVARGCRLGPSRFPRGTTIAKATFIYPAFLILTAVVIGKFSLLTSHRQCYILNDAVLIESELDFDPSFL